MDQARLRELTSQFSSRRIAVVGDYFLDKYIDFDSDLEETSMETNLPANQVVQIRHSPGAAGNIVGNLVSLNAGEVIPIGFTGDDGEGYDLRKDLVELRCSDNMILRIAERYTPTYLKPCNFKIGGIAGEQARYDTKNREYFPQEYEARIIDCIRKVAPHVDAVIIADQADEEDCGVITRSVREAICRLADELSNTIFWVDSRRRIGQFYNVMLKPNKHEAVTAALPDYTEPITDDTVIKAGNILNQRSGKPVFLTRSEKGIIVFDKSEQTEVRGIRVDGPIDPTGAGDSATAAAVLALTSGASSTEAALLANLSGSITVRQLGTTGRASIDQLADALDQWMLESTAS